MKKYINKGNAELDEILVSNGFNLIVNEKMEILISDEDAEAIDKFVAENAEASMGDYCFEDVEC